MRAVFFSLSLCCTLFVSGQLKPWSDYKSHHQTTQPVIPPPPGIHCYTNPPVPKSSIRISPEDSTLLSEETKAFNYEDFLTDRKVQCSEILMDAEFPGGEIELFHYLKREIYFSEEMKSLGISGIVYIQFIVEKDGTISNILLAKGLHPLYDTEALRIVQNMPKWSPGLNICNEPVQIRYTLPVKFEFH